MTGGLLNYCKAGLTTVRTTLHMKKQPEIPDALHQESQIRVLRFLMRNDSTEWGGREIARMVKLSAPSTHEALKRLYARGLVQYRHISNTYLYKVNPHNYLVKNVFGPLFKAEKDIPAEINKLIKRMLTAGKDRILSLTIFGSRARGDETLFSDLDLAVVVKDKASVKAADEDLGELSHQLYLRFSIKLSPYINTLAEFRGKHKKGLGVVKNIIKEGKCIYGTEPRELVN